MPFYYVKSRVTNNDHSHMLSRKSNIGLFVNVHYQPLLPTAINTATADVFKSGTHLVIILHLF